MTDPLPAMKSLGDLSAVRPVIVIDSREQAPLPFSELESITSTLISGDYSALGLETLFSVERKSINDLVGSLTGERARFIRELERLRGYRFARLLIVGTPSQLAAGDYRSNAKPVAMLHSLYSIEARFVPVVFAPTPAALRTCLHAAPLPRFPLRRSNRLTRRSSEPPLVAGRFLFAPSGRSLSLLPLGLGGERSYASR